MDLPTANSSAHQQRGEGVRPMVASGRLGVGTLRKLADLGGCDETP